MLRQDKLYTSYNPYFIVPFLIWLVLGGLAIMVSDRETLFRLFNTHSAPFLDWWIPKITQLGEGLVITITLAALLAIPKLQNRWYIIAAISAPALPSILVQIIKAIVNADRPLTHFKSAGWLRILPEWEHNFHHSFPSGHTCGAFSMFTLLACLLPLRHRWWGLIFFILALLVGYSRIYLSQHFFADVYVGSIIGVSFTIFIISVLRRYGDVLLKRSKKQGVDA